MRLINRTFRNFWRLWTYWSSGIRLFN